MNTKTFTAVAIGCSLAVLAAGCERQAAKPPRTNGAVAQAGAESSGTSYGRSDAADSGGGSQAARSDGPTYKDGAPTWAANRKHSSEENVEYQFNKNGAAFGARTADDYVAKVHAFLSDPPKGVDSVTRTSNGDKLYYDAKSNTLVVANSAGAPRTMFKPRGDGRQYWQEQVASAKEPRSTERPRSRGNGAETGGSNDNG